MTDLRFQRQTASTRGQPAAAVEIAAAEELRRLRTSQQDEKQRPLAR